MADLLHRNKRIKTDVSIIPETEQEIEEFVRCAHPETGAEYFAENFFKVVNKKYGLMDLQFYPYQRELMQSYVNNELSINMLSRQKGKTTVATAYILWLAMFRPHTHILIAANREKNTKDIMKRIKVGYEECPNHIRDAVEAYNAKSIEFANKSSIMAEATTENTGRGFSVSLLYLDEFAFVAPSIAEEFWTSLQPTLSDGGRCIITSTPNNKDDVFASIWHDAIKNTDEKGNILCEMDERWKTPKGPGRNGFQAFIAKWDRDGMLMKPPRDEKWKEDTIQALGGGNKGKGKFKREHECEFVTWDETLIDALVLDQILYGDNDKEDDEGDVEDPVKTINEVHWWKRPTDGNTYVVCLDPAVGTGGDNAAIQVLEAPSLEQVAEWRDNHKDIYAQMDVMRKILEFIADETGYDETAWDGTNIYWSVDVVGIGEGALVAIDAIGEENFPGELVGDPKARKAKGRRRRTLYTTKETKMEACLLLKSLLENDRRLELRSKELVLELDGLVYQKNKTYKAKAGKKDDLADALLMTMRLLKYAAIQDEEIDLALNPYEARDEDAGYEDEDEEPLPFGVI